MGVIDFTSLMIKLITKIISNRWVTWAAGILGMFRLPASVVWAWNWYLLGPNVRGLGHIL